MHSPFRLFRSLAILGLILGSLGDAACITTAAPLPRPKQSPSRKETIVYLVNHSGHPIRQMKYVFRCGSSTSSATISYPWDSFPNDTRQILFKIHHEGRRFTLDHLEVTSNLTRRIIHRETEFEPVGFLIITVGDEGTCRVAPTNTPP